MLMLVSRKKTTTKKIKLTCNLSFPSLVVSAAIKAMWV